MNDLKRVPVRELSPSERILSFAEVSLGYSEEEAIEEATRCLQCKNPLCMEGCPVHIDIPGFIRKITEKDTVGAFQIIDSASSLPSICGRVCPQETQCEGRCVRGLKGDPIAIGKLERFVADTASTSHDTASSDCKKRKVGIIGSGPAGLAAAGELLKRGYKVTVYEALHLPGGVLMYGIPAFRLPKDVVMGEIKRLISNGAEFRTNVIIGKTLSIKDLFEKEHCDAVFIGTGAGLPRFMNIPGENGNQVFSANEFLVRVNLMKGYDSSSDTPIPKLSPVVVVGGGNVAMDAARIAKRLPAETHIVYRRSENEMPARLEEIEHAKEEGIEFHFLRNPKEILLDEEGNVTGVRVISMELSEPDSSGRRKPVEVVGSETVIPCKAVIMAIGTSPNPVLFRSEKDLPVSDRGLILTKGPSGETSVPHIFAGGDAVTGAATVILAMQAGKDAAIAIDESFTK